MISFFKKRTRDILRVVLVIASIAFIVYLFPKTSNFQQSYEKGKPWTHENLIAEFDFAIHKNDDELQNEIDEAYKNLEPHYAMDDAVYEKEKKQFVKAFNKSITEFNQDTSSQVYLDSTKHINFALGLLSNVYSKGIVKLKNEHKVLKNDDVVVVVKNTVADKRKIGEVFDKSTAKDYFNKSIEENDQFYGKIYKKHLQDAIEFNVFYDDSLNAKLRTEIENELSPTKGLVQEGEMIVAQGNIVSEEKWQVINSYKKEFEKRTVDESQSKAITFGYTLIIAILITLFAIYIYQYEKVVFDSNRKFLFVLLLMMGMILMVKGVSQANNQLIYVIPFCIVPILLRTFFGVGLAFWAHIIVVVVSGFMIQQGSGFVFIQLAAGMIALFGKARYLSQFFQTIGLIFTVYFLGYVGLQLVLAGDFLDINPVNVGWLAANSFLTLLAFVLIPVFEKLFGFISDITLSELSDLNKPLLKKLSIEAPGSFQHSLQVANLAEAAAFEIGANAMLVKVGALYHDVGKMHSSIHYTENQSGFNPHDKLPHKDSAKIIIDHVTKGVEIAKKQGLPNVLIDFIKTHHGTTRVEYFYQNHIKDNPENEKDEPMFRYPGPKPFSKETAILMMADTVEAASKSLRDPRKDEISNLVDRLVEHQMKQQQFANCDLTFKDVTTCKNVFKKMLASIHHVRVKYPGQK